MMRLQKGFTMTEVLVASAAVFLLMTMGMKFYQNLSSQWQLADSETRMQQQSREAMLKINKELRQATAYFEVPFDGLPQAKEILMIRPNSDMHSGQVQGYTLVRYWFRENQDGVYSLLRAEKDHGNEDRFLGNEMAFQPDITNASDKVNYKIRYLVKEATVIEPGKQSFFQQSPANPNLIHVRMVTATYGAGSKDGTKKYEVKRKFRVDTDIHARNLAL